MPLFAAMVSAFFNGLALFLARLFAAKVAIRVAAVAAIGAFGTALMLTFNNFVAPLVAQLFATSYGQLLGLAFPPVAGTVLAGVATLWVACTTYKLQVHAVKVTANI